LDTSSAGAKSGSAGILLTSNGANSGLADTALDPQTVAMSGSVYDHGVASLDSAAKVDTIDIVLLGNLNATVAKSYDIFNLLQTAGYTGRLDLISFSGEGDTATLDSGLSTFTALDAGSSKTFTASMDTRALGTYSAVYTLDLTDAVSDGISGDVEHQTLHIQIDGQVVPEPSTAILLAVALLGLGAYLRRRGS
jgi:hypothetical protein